MKPLTAPEMRELDRLTIERQHLPGIQLMEAAGKHVAESILRACPPQLSHRILVLCGKGNNGADGLVCARHLKEAGRDPRVWFFGAEPPSGTDAGVNFERWRQLGGAIAMMNTPAEWHSKRHALGKVQVIVDALLGTGIRGSAEGLIAEAIEEINRVSQNATAARPALIIAVDTPSGLPSDGEPAAGPVLFVHRTVTFTAPKIGQLESSHAACVGALDVVQIGSHRSLVDEVAKSDLRWAEPSEFAALPLVRKWDSNKGVYGHALLVAGATGKTGAAILSGSAALRGGAGLVTIATPESALPMVANAHPEYMTEPLAASPQGAVALKNWSDGHFTKLAAKRAVVAIGPGLGTASETQEFVRAVVQNVASPLILDADGLNAFAGCAAKLRDRQAQFLAITPHPGEMARLCNKSISEVQSDRLNIARYAARDWNVHIVLKGFHTIVADPAGNIFINTSGNPGLAKGGSGDVLTGFLSALTAQFGTADWLRVLTLGVYLHGKAAEIATASTDISGLLSSDLVNALPAARRAFLRELQQIV